MGDEREWKAETEAHSHVGMGFCRFSHFTLNFKVSLSNKKLELSEIAFARQMGTRDALSSADSELLGLPDLTSACVPADVRRFS